MYEVEEIEESVGRDCAKDINAIFKYTSAKNNIGIEVKFSLVKIFFRKCLRLLEINIWILPGKIQI